MYCFPPVYFFLGYLPHEESTKKEHDEQLNSLTWETLALCEMPSKVTSQNIWTLCKTQLRQNVNIL